MDLETLGQRLLDIAKTSGADAADCMVVHGTSVSVDVRNGVIEHVDRSEGVDLGLRVLVGQSQAVVSISDTNDHSLLEMGERAVAMAREAPKDPYAGLADPSQLGMAVSIETLEMADPSAEPDPTALQRDAQEAESAALAYDGVTQVQSASAGYGVREIYLAASNGFAGGYQRTDRGISCVAIAGTGTGMERASDGDVRVFQSDLRTAQDIGQTAAERAVAMLGARKPPSGAWPVIYDEKVSSSLIGHLLAAANGASVGRGSSWLLGRLGEDVLPKALSLIEEPHRPRAAASRPFDAEGLPTATRRIIDQGVLTGWTLDLVNGRKLDMPSTANAVRGVASAPSPGVSNVALTQGRHSKEELLAEMGTGLLVTSLIGATINPNTGDYSRGAAGFWVENGQIAYPVNECTIAGSLPDFLKTLIPANDARTHLSRVVPSLLVEGLTIA